MSQANRITNLRSTSTPVHRRAVASKTITTAFLLVGLGLLSQEAWPGNFIYSPSYFRLDATINCATDGDGHLSKADGTYDYVGKGLCNFHDDNGTPTDLSDDASGDGFCKMEQHWRNLDVQCTNDKKKHTSQLVATAYCPQSDTDSNMTGFLNCEGGTKSDFTGSNPFFCTYEGLDPFGNATTFCQVNFGFGYYKGSHYYPYLTSKLCSAAYTGPVLQMTVDYAEEDCLGDGRVSKYVSDPSNFNHSDSFDPSKLPAQEVDKQTKQVKNVVDNAAAIISFTAYADATPQSVQSGCQNTGVLTLSIFSDGQTPGTDNIDASKLVESSVRINNVWPVIEGSGSFDPTSGIQTYKVYRCDADGNNIVYTDPAYKDGDATFTMKVDADLVGGNHVESNEITKGVSN